MPKWLSQKRSLMMVACLHSRWRAALKKVMLWLKKRIELQQNNLPHGLKLETMITELVDHYGWEIWMRQCAWTALTLSQLSQVLLNTLRRLSGSEKVENFYLYVLKRMPKASDIEYQMPPLKNVPTWFRASWTNGALQSRFKLH